VPFAGNTHELQNRQTDTAKWFMQTVGKVNPRTDQGETTQGFYVIGADGSAYVFNNNRSVERVLDFMRRGHEGFQAKPPVETQIPMNQSVQLKPPPGTTVLRLYSRIKPAPAGCDPANENLQRDHLWILPEEVASLATLQAPQALVNRLCRFTLVDAIRGEPDFWKPEEVRTSKFKVMKNPKGGYVLKGPFAMQTADGKRGLEGTLEAEFNIAAEKITAFKGFAGSTAWGSGTYTPGAPAGKFPLKFAFLLAPASKETVAPQAAMFGREYLGR
jgi:hypothetical protein